MVLSYFIFSLSRQEICRENRIWWVEEEEIWQQELESQLLEEGQHGVIQFQMTFIPHM